MPGYNYKDSQTIPPLFYNLFPKVAGEVENWDYFYQQVKKMNFNWIYINPIHPVGFSGSLYAVKDLLDLNKEFFKSDDKNERFNKFKNTINSAHQHGLKVMLDLVINHQAIDSVLVKEKKYFFKHNKDGSILNPSVWEGDKLITIWGDLAEIDHDNNKIKDDIIGYFKNVIKLYLDYGVDGFRCDAAYKVPTSTWKELIDYAGTIKYPVLFAAETLGCTIEQLITLIDAGFDLAFNSSKWWNFKDDWCLTQYFKAKCVTSTVSFPESHDTQRLSDECNGDLDYIKMKYVFSAFFSTGLLVPAGFEFGIKKALHVVHSKPEDLNEHLFDISEFIAQINQIKLNKISLHQDCELKIIDDINPVFGFYKSSNNYNDHAIVILNPQNKEVKINLTNINKIIRDHNLKNLASENITYNDNELYFNKYGWSIWG